MVIGYTVTIDSGTFLGDALSMSGFGQSGDASLDISETVCAGAAYTQPGNLCLPPGVVKSLNIFDNAHGFKAMDSVTFANAPVTLGIVKDISVLGGPSGEAQVSMIDNITPFAAPAVPDAPTYSLIGAGLLALGAKLRSKLG